jgi:tetratricopeptide (TPR) repeat protein
MDAAIKNHDENGVNRLIVIYKFKMEGGSDSLRSLESLLPEVLRAYFLGLGWHATIETELGMRGDQKIFPVEKKRAPMRHIHKTAAAQVAGPGFIVRGSFFESKEIVTIDASLEHAKTGEKIIVTKKFDKRNLLAGIESLGKSLEEKIQGSFLKTVERKKKILAVRCFDFANVGGADVSNEDLTYGWMRQQFAKALSLACQEIEMVQVARWGEVKRLCKASPEVLLQELDADLIVTGEYEVVNDEILNVRAHILNSSSPKNIGPIDMSGRLDNFFGLEKDFYELVKEVVVLFLNPTETLEARNLFAPNLDADALLRTGVESSKQGRKAIALWLCDKALEKNSNLPSAHFEKGVIHEEKENFDKAIEELRKAVELKPNFSKAMLHLGSIAIKRGDPDEAIKQYRRAIDIEDDLEAEARLKLGDVYFLQGKFDDALSEYEAARERDPYNADIYYALSLVSLTQNDYHNAIPDLIRALRIKPDHSEALSNLAQAYYHYGEELIRASRKEPTEKEKNRKLDEAVTLLKKSIELKESAEAYGRLAWAYSSAKRYKEAYKAAKKAVRLNPNYAWYTAGLGRILLALGKPEEAVRELNRAVKSDPEHVFAHLYLGVAYKELDNNELAKDNFEKAWNLGLEKDDYRMASLAMDNASEIAPDNSLYFARSGEAYRMLGEYDKALVKLKRAVKIEPQPAWVYGSLGDVYRLKGDFKRAEENFKKSLDLDPDSAWAYAHLGEAFREQGDLDRAKENLKKAISLDPDSAWAYASLGEVYRQKGKFQKAIKNLEKAIALHPALARAYLSLGDVYRQKGEFDKAQENLKKVISLHPDFAWAYNELAVIIHENIFDYEEALKNAREAVRLESKARDKKNLMTYQSTLAEALVTAGRFDEAYERTEEIIAKADDNSIVLNIRMVQIVSLLLRNQEGIARSKVDAFIEFYEDLPRDFQNDWSYNGISHFLETQDKLSYKRKDLLVSMIRLLKKEIDLSQFETVSKRYFSEEKISGAYFLPRNSLALIFRNL